MDKLISQLETNVPFCQFLGISFSQDKQKNLIGKMEFQDHIVGNPITPALHGGGIAGFMEAVGLSSLIYEKSRETPDFDWTLYPKTINITADYLRPGLAKTSYARADIRRMGRRFASVYVLAWQNNRNLPIAEAMCHFLIADWNTK